jgi:hypothetical protein
VSAERLSAYTLGTNVTYRPGVRMVKFTTEPKTYAVAGGGILRWVSSEQAARSLYGNDWNTKIDDVADVFYTNYHFGTDVASMNDFVPSAESAAAPTFD